MGILVGCLDVCIIRSTLLTFNCSTEVHFLGRRLPEDCFGQDSEIQAERYGCGSREGRARVGVIYKETLCINTSVACRDN